MQKKIFITGTDTDVGKTSISCFLLREWQKQGLQVAGIKPIATGAQSYQNQLYSHDALLLQGASNCELPYSVINPRVFEPPVAPHLAASLSNKTLSASELHQIVQPALAQPMDILLIEGIGGWMVPLNAKETMADFVRLLNIPVILVVRIRLGALNHALLTANAIIHYQLPLYGWIANCIDQDMLLLEENIATLQTMLPAPCLGIIPFHSQNIKLKCADIACRVLQYLNPII